MSRIFFSLFIFFSCAVFFYEKRKMMYDCKMHCRVKLKLLKSWRKILNNFSCSVFSTKCSTSAKTCRAHMNVSTKVLLSVFHAYFCFQFFFSLSRSLPSNGICLCLHKHLAKRKNFFAATRFCCSHFFNLKTHRKEFLIRHKRGRGKEKFSSFSKEWKVCEIF